MKLPAISRRNSGKGHPRSLLILLVGFAAAGMLTAAGKEPPTDGDRDPSDIFICINCPPGGSLIYYEDFEWDDGDWYFQQDPSFVPPRAVYESNKLKLNAQGSTDCFGYWQSPEIHVGENRLYRAVFGVSAYADTDTECPQFRLRVTVVDPDHVAYQACWMQVVSSTGNGNYSPTDDPEYYEVFFRTPNDADDVQLEFDLLSFDGVNDNPYVSVRLEEVWVEWLG